MSATSWHYPRALPTTEQQGHLPSAPVETEPCAAALQHPLREFREAPWAPGNLVGPVFG